MLGKLLSRGQACSGDDWAGLGLPGWAVRGVGPWAVLVWVPILLLDPILSASDADPAWPAWLAIAGIFGTFTGTVLSARNSRVQLPYLPELLLLAEFALTVAVAGYGPHWYILFTLLAIGTGTVASPRWAMPAILTVTGTAVGVISAHSGWDQAWGNGLSCFLSGAATFLFHRLFAAIAELNRTREELARTAVSEERLRFSRDLHDLLGHTLSVMVVKAEVVRRLVPRDPQLAVQHARDIETIGREGLVEVRQAVNGYRGPRLEVELDRARTGLAAAGIAVDIVEAARPLPSDTDTLLAWIVREGVTNVIRHSGASRCSIAVRIGRDRAHLDLTDDGTNGGSEADGGGLRGLRERVAAAGGTVDAGLLNRGFGIAVDIPFTESAPLAEPELVDSA